MSLAIDDYEAAGGSFETQFPGHCTINRDHKIKRGDRVVRVQRADNPLIPVPGVACKNCTKILPRAKR